MQDEGHIQPCEIALADREYCAEDNYPCPFPCDKWYDRKAWRWLCAGGDFDDLPERRCP